MLLTASRRIITQRTAVDITIIKSSCGQTFHSKNRLNIGGVWILKRHLILLTGFKI
jgi:hypothetical protein